MAGVPEFTAARRVAAQAARERAARSRAHSVAFGAGLGALVLVALAAFGTGYSYKHAAANPPPVPDFQVPADTKAYKQAEKRLEQRQRQLQASIEKKAPKGVYIVIDQTQNQLFLRKDNEQLLEAKCSAGSGMVLQERGGRGRRWVFDTPRGTFHVRSREESPMWKKPDWAFIEEGKPIPRNDEARFDPGSLGEYALYLGDGYMIHGTLYERFLGRSVSHGCIRVGRDDLREVWRATTIGTPVFIY
jgi:lipoprotein-anchoring transpeptidase ErfK/SrfK